MTLAVERHTSLGGAGAPEVDGLLAGRGMYLSAAWLRFCELNPRFTVTYLLARDGDRPVGLLPTYLAEGGGNPLYDPYEVVEGLDAGAATPRRPLLLAGTRSGYVNELVALDGPSAPAADVRDALLGELSRLRAETRAASLAWMYLTEAEADRLARLQPGAVRLLTTAACTLDAGFADHDAYVSGLPPSRRSIVRRERRRFAASGLTVTEEPFADHLDEVLPLFSANLARHGHDHDPRLLRRTLAGQLAQLGDAARVLLLHDGPRLIGALYATVWDGVLYAQHIGFDYARTGARAEYFNLLVHEPLRLAIDHGLRAVDLGTESYKAKALRGARLSPRWSLLLGPVEEAHRRAAVARSHNERALARFAEEGLRWMV